MTLIQTKTFQLATYVAGNSDAPKLALVLPGKLDSKDYAHMRSHVEFLASKGYLALSFDPPGTWESPGDISLYTMSNYVLAVNELIEYFGNKPTFVVGHSRGGSIAMLTGTANSHITAFASIMSFYSFHPAIHGEFPDLRWQQRGYRDSLRDLPEDPLQSRAFRVPYSFLEDQIQYDVLDGLKSSAKPKLFVLGKNDVTVKPEYVRSCYEQAKEPKMLYELESDHNYRSDPQLIEQVNTFIGKFIQQFSL